MFAKTAPSWEPGGVRPHKNASCKVDSSMAGKSVSFGDLKGAAQQRAAKLLSEPERVDACERGRSPNCQDGAELMHLPGHFL